MLNLLYVCLKTDRSNVPLQFLRRSACWQRSSRPLNTGLGAAESSSICGHHLDQRAPHCTRAPSKAPSAWVALKPQQVLAMADMEFAAAQAAGNSGHYRAPQQQRRGRGGQYPRQGDGRPPKAQRTSAVHQAAPAAMSPEDTGDLRQCCAAVWGQANCRR